MPQMSPMLWSILFLFFTLLFLLFNGLNYFNFSPIYKSINKTNNKEINPFIKNKNLLTWKW